MDADGGSAFAPGHLEQLSTRQLVREITSRAYLLVGREVDLAKAELREDLRAQLTMVKALAVAAVAAVAGLSVLLVAVALALSQVMPAWLAALLVGVAVLALAAAVGLYGWSRRVRSPLDATRRTLREDLRWAKDRWS
jgi:uncharacterized membrane protein YqjE